MLFSTFHQHHRPLRAHSPWRPFLLLGPILPLAPIPRVSSVLSLLLVSSVLRFCQCAGGGLHEFPSLQNLCNPPNRPINRLWNRPSSHLSALRFVLGSFAPSQNMRQTGPRRCHEMRTRPACGTGRPTFRTRPEAHGDDGEDFGDCDIERRSPCCYGCRGCAYAVNRIARQTVRRIAISTQRWNSSKPHIEQSDD